MIQGNRSPIPKIGAPPEQYDSAFMLTMIRALSDLQQIPFTPRDVLVNGITWAVYPASGYGLQPGQVWVDGDGVMRVVRQNDAFSSGLALGLKAGRVTVP